MRVYHTGTLKTRKTNSAKKYGDRVTPTCATVLLWGFFNKGK